MSASSSARQGQTQANAVQVYYTGTDILEEGQALFYDHDASDTAVRRYNVEKPSLNNIGHYAGHVAPGQPRSARQGPCLVQIEVADGQIHQTKIRTNLSITAGDLLAPIPGTYNFAKFVGISGNRPLYRALETVDRSTTAGLVTVEFGALNLSEAEISKKCVRFFDDFLGFSTFAAAVANTVADQTTYQLTGATAVAVYQDDIQGGVVKLTSTTTTQANLQCNGENYVLSAGKTCYFRCKMKVTSIAAGLSAFVGLSITDTAWWASKPSDYIGFEETAGAISFVYRKASGTAISVATGITMVADTFVDVCFVYDGNNNIYVYIDEVQCTVNGVTGATVNLSATQIAQIPNVEFLTLTAEALGTSAVVQFIDWWEANNAR